MQSHTCQRYRALAKTAEPGSSRPAAAAQPMSGGTAPTTAPTQVLAMLTTFSGVYTPAYSPMFAAPSAAVKPLLCKVQAVSLGGPRFSCHRADQDVASMRTTLAVNDVRPHLPVQQCDAASAYSGCKGQGMIAADDAHGQGPPARPLHECVIRSLIPLQTVTVGSFSHIAVANTQHALLVLQGPKERWCPPGSVRWRMQRLPSCPH